MYNNCFWYIFTLKITSFWMANLSKQMCHCHNLKHHLETECKNLLASGTSESGRPRNFLVHVPSSQLLSIPQNLIFVCYLLVLQIKALLIRKLFHKRLFLQICFKAVDIVYVKRFYLVYIFAPFCPLCWCPFPVAMMCSVH